MSNNQLIPVFAGEIAGVSAQLVDARTLHIFLESKQRFADWIKNRINDFDFDENTDYTVHKIMTQYNQLDRIEYYLTLDMAKELSMVERNAKGKQARRYFIECEKRLLSQIPENIVLAYEILVENLPYVKPITDAISLTEYQARKSALLQGLHDLNSVKIVLTGEELEAFRNLH